MSYRNPTQHIDRQSGQIEQNLQKTLANIGTGVVSSINKIHTDNAAKTAAIRAEADKRVADAQNSIMQTQSKNPTADFGDLDEQLNLMNGLLMKDPAKRTAAEKTFINSMENIGDNMANMLKNTAMSQEAMMEQVNKIPGTMGSVDPKANPEQYAKLSVLANQTEGRTKARYKVNKNGQIVFSLDVYQKTKDGEKFVGSVINDNVATTQMPTVIPNINKEMDDAITKVLNTNDFTSELDEFTDAKGAKIYKNKKTGVRVTEKYFRDKLQAQALPIIMGMSEREKASLYNNIFKKSGEDFSYSDGRLTDLQKNTKDLILAKAFMDEMMERTKLKSKVLGNIVKSKIPTKKGSAGNLSQVDKRTKDAAKKFKKVLDWDGKGNPPVNTIMAANNQNQQLLWKPSKSGEPARWVLREKEKGGWNTLGAYRPNALEKIANQLGFDFAEKGISEKDSVIFTDNIQPYTENKSKEGEIVIDYSQFEE